MMENGLVFSTDSSLDRFLNQVTTNVLRYAIERVVEVSDTINIEERVLLEQLNNDLLEDSILQDTSGVETDFEDIKNDSDDIDSATIQAKCSKLIEDTLAEAFTEVKSVLEAERLEIAEEAEAHERKLRLLQCIKDSESIQNLFQDISVNIIQDALGRVKNEAREKDNHFEGGGSEQEYQIEENIYENMNNENDILPNINQKEGNATGSVCNNQNLSGENTVGVLHEMAAENDRTFSKNDIDFGNATTESSFHSLANESSGFQSEITNDNLSNSAAFTTANSVMFKTAEEQQSSGLDSSPGTFVSFNNEGSLLPEATTTNELNLPDTPVENDIDKTLTEFQGPRQSTPLGKESPSQEMTFSAENSNISVFDNSQVVTHDSESTTNAEPELEVFADDDSSSSNASSPRTLSRQSSAFGNVTLEFDQEWESGIHTYQNNSKTIPTKEVKHTVILHELSFDERADLKAPDLLGPVFLAVQDDDEDTKRKHKLSQSIDDLCEMISDDEEETELPLRRRAMSLECKKPPAPKTQRMKVPTKDELIKAFQELRNEIMEEKDIDDEEVDDEKQTELEESVNELNEEVEKIVEYEDQQYEIKQVDEDEQEELNEQEEKGMVEGVDENESEEPEEGQSYIENEKEKDDEVEMGGLKEDVEDIEGEDSSITEPNSMDRNITDDLMTIRPEGDDPLRWQTVVFNGQNKLIDLKILEPYLKVLTHGGYHHKDGKKAVIVILTACNLPDKKLKNYALIMEQLFFFIVSTMDVLITSDEYIFVYFHGGADKNQSPSLSWLKKYYQYINRRLRKSVTNIYIVHPNLWLKSVYRLSRPFLSSNFARKLKFVNSLKELSNHVKTDFIYIPDEVIRVDPEYKKIHRS